jgi:hypothetical protein
MNLYNTQILVSDHIREARQQAAAAQRAGEARAARRAPARHAARRGMHWLARSA